MVERAAARLSIVLWCWRKRAQQALLQQRARHLGHAVSLRRAMHGVCGWRARRKSHAQQCLEADLHHHHALLRAVLAAWREGRAVHRETLAKNSDALALRAAHLSRACWSGWVGYVRLSVIMRRVLVGRALRLLHRCLGGWGSWLAARRLKRSAKTTLRCRGRERRLALALPEWTVAAEEKRVLVASMRAAEAVSRLAALTCALCHWRATRDAAARTVVRVRRAHVFRAGRLLGLVYAAWRGLPATRKRLDAAVPRVATRLATARLRLRLGRWQFAAAAAASWRLVLHQCDQRARRLALSSAAASLRIPVLWRRRIRAAQWEASAATRTSALTRHLRGWCAAYVRRAQARVATVAMVRATRRWRRVAATGARTAGAVSAGRLVDSRRRARRAVRAWGWVAATRRIEQAMIEAASRSCVAGVRRAALHRWAARTQLAVCARAAAATSSDGALIRTIGWWRLVTVRAEAAEAAWRRAVRHRYLRLLHGFFLGWRLYLSRRYAHWSLRESVHAALSRRRRQRSLLAWSGHASAASRRDTRARAHALARALRASLSSWSVAATDSRALASRSSAADDFRAGALCLWALGRWVESVDWRDARREARAAQLAVHRAALARGVRARAFWRWRDVQQSVLVQATVLESCTGALHARRRASALGSLHANVVRRRIEHGRRRIAIVAAAACVVRRTVAGWSAYVWWREAHQASRRRAEAAHAARICAACWGGWELYHVRKQHKAAMMASAVARHRHNMRASTAAVWLEVGLARHAEKVEWAAARTARRAAESHRLAERYARKWRAAVAKRRAARELTDAPRTSGSVDGRSPLPAAACVVVFQPSARCSSPAARMATPCAPRAEAERASLARRGMHPAASPPAAMSAVPSDDWDLFLPATSTRRAPRPLPKFDASDAVPLRLPFGMPAPPPAPGAAASPPAASPPAPPEPLVELVNWAEVRRVLHAPTAPSHAPQAPLPPTSHRPPLQHAALGQPAQSALEAAVASAPSRDRAEVSHPDSSGDGLAERGAGQAGETPPEVREVQEIEARLRRHAALKERHLANQRLRDRLAAQAKGLPPAQRPALLEATRQLQSEMDAYLDPRAAAARQTDVERLALRVTELAELRELACATAAPAGGEASAGSLWSSERRHR